MLIVVQQPAALGLLLVLLLLDPAAGRMLIFCFSPLLLPLLAPPVYCWELPTVLGPFAPFADAVEGVHKNHDYANSASFMKFCKKTSSGGIRSRSLSVMVDRLRRPSSGATTPSRAAQKGLLLVDLGGLL